MTHPLAPLHAWPQFIPVKLVPRADGRTDKLPIDYRTGQVTARGSEGAHDPAIWLPHDRAALTAQMLGPDHGVGFVLTAADTFFCLDVDGALQSDGQWSALSQQLVQSMPGCAVEVSQSGRGLHVWGRAATMPPHAKKHTALHIELYSARRFILLGSTSAGTIADNCAALPALVERYFAPRAARADLPDDGPRPDWRGPADDADLLRRALASKGAASVFGTRATFADLYDANADALARAYPSTTGDAYDRSSADAALAQHLAFWTGCDAHRINRLMRSSKLVREKWERSDYLPDTIENARGMQGEVLQDKPSAIETMGLVPAAPAPAELPEPQLAPARPARVAAGPSMTPVEGSTFLSAADQARLFHGCVYIEDLNRVLVPGGKLRSAEGFRAKFGGFSFAMDARNERVSRNAWEAFTESQVLRAPRADGVCFRPQLPYGAIVADAGRTRANQWWPVDTPRIKGDAEPFRRHLRLLLPDQRDAMILLCYMAAIVQYPGRKFQWAPVIQGVEGNGKTFLSRCVAEAIGQRYVHWPKASKLAKQFNAWMVGKLFFAVEDIHTSDGQLDVIEELKPMITGGDGLEIEAKGVDQVSAEICGNFIFNTNHRAGLRKTRNDRRFAVFYCAQQAAEDLTRDGMTGDYMAALYDWAKLRDGYAIVNDFLRTFVIPDEFNPATSCQRAPHTSSTDEAVRAGLGHIEQEVLEAVEQSRPGFAGGWISSMMFDALIKELSRGRAISPQKRADILRDLGYVRHPALPEGRVNAPVLPDGGKTRLYVTKMHAALRLTVQAEVAKAYTVAQTSK